MGNQMGAIFKTEGVIRIVEFFAYCSNISPLSTATMQLAIKDTTKYL